MTSHRQRTFGVLGAAALLAGSLAPASAAVGTTSGTSAGSATVAADGREGMPGVWWYDAMKLDEVHQVATGKGVKVAVIDGHLDARIPDLKGAKISQGTSCQYDTKAELYTGQIASHGTAMVTAIVGQGAGGKGILGVAPDAEVRFYSYDPKAENPGNECDATLIARQVDKAVTWGADVISMSLGVGAGLDESVDRAIDAGAVVVASSGEVPDGVPRAEQPIELPGGIPGVVAVVAGTNQGKVWSKNPMGTQYEGSQLNDWLGLVAPGVETPLGGFRSGSDLWQTAAPRTGTSGATAIAAGAFAVLKSRWPEATGNQLVQAALHAAGGRDSDGELGYDKVQGYGTLSLRTTLAQDPTGWPDENPLRLPPGEAIEAYPASSYTQPGDAASEPTAQDDGGSGTGTTGASAAADDAAASDDGSLPGWVLPAGAVVLVGLAAGALLLRRRSTGADRPGASSSGDEQTTDTTYDHTAPRGS